MKLSRTQYIAVLLILILLSACAPPHVQVLSTQTKTVTVDAASTKKSTKTPAQTVTSIPAETEEINMLPDSDRVHYLGEAETALKEGNPLLAISYYEIAARDPNLTSYPTKYEFEHKQTELAKPYQQAFAFFRIVAIWYYLDRPDMADPYIEEISESFPKGKPGYEFVLAAQAISDNYEKEGDFTKSCGQAEYVFQSLYLDVIAYHLIDWGVENPMYSSIDDICKVGREKLPTNK